MSYDAFQKVFSLSLAANGVKSLKGTQESLQKALAKEVSIVLRLLGADWKVVWGPTVWKHEPKNAETGPDNAWYVAYHPEFQFEDGSVHPTYVIAIAGTPKYSQYVWVEQNLAVFDVSDFNLWVTGGIESPPAVVPSASIQPGAAYIAIGTVRTTHLLLNTKGPKEGTEEGKRLLKFIKGLDQSLSPRFIFTGHSLGGALSPSLALALVQAGDIPAAHTLTYPTAGASPGDTDFAQLFAKTLPPRKADGAKSYQGWNLNLVNDRDIVPQAWALNESVSPGQNLGRVPAIYSTPILPLVQDIVDMAILESDLSDVLYHPISSQHFTRPPAPTTPTDLDKFIAIAKHQHVQVYRDELGVNLALPNPTSVEGVTEKTEAEEGYNYPFIIDFQWAYDHPKKARELLDRVKSNKQAKPYLAETEKEVRSEA